MMLDQSRRFRLETASKQRLSAAYRHLPAAAADAAGTPAADSRRSKTIMSSGGVASGASDLVKLETDWSRRLQAVIEAGTAADGAISA